MSYVNIDSVYDGSYLQGLRLLITGANRGLGLATAKQLLKDGAMVICVGRRQCLELESFGAEVITGVDVTDEAAVKKMASRLSSPVDIIINNAGYFMEVPENIETVNPKEDLLQINICAVGPLLVSSALYNAGKIKGGGRIICIVARLALH